SRDDRLLPGYDTLAEAPRTPLPWTQHGINAGQGFIRQFVAVPLGSGATVEGQLTGQEIHGGVQLRAVGLTRKALKRWRADRARRVDCMSLAGVAPTPAMGLGAGGRMRQEVYRDDRAHSDYTENRSWRVFVHLCSATQWTAITGEVPPPTPVDRDVYVEAGLPWFDYFDADASDLAPSETLTQVKTVGDLLADKDDAFVPVDPTTIVSLKDPGGETVADGAW
ncbi:hypothetical protein, partial [Mycobacterium celatum]